MSSVSTLKPVPGIVDVQQSFTQMPFGSQGIHALLKAALVQLVPGCRAASVWR